MTVSDKDIKYWGGFSLVPGIGRVKLAHLESYFGNLENAWKAAPTDLKHAGLDSNSICSLTSCQPQISLEAEMEKLDRYGVKEIYDYSPILYVKGSLLPEDEWCLAVVGTRRATVYGRQMTKEIVTDLARSRITIVSGLAKGIDSIVHRSALDASG